MTFRGCWPGGCLCGCASMTPSHQHKQLYAEVLSILCMCVDLSICLSVCVCVCLYCVCVCVSVPVLCTDLPSVPHCAMQWPCLLPARHTHDGRLWGGHLLLLYAHCSATCHVYAEDPAGSHAGHYGSSGPRVENLLTGPPSESSRSFSHSLTVSLSFSACALHFKFISALLSV